VLEHAQETTRIAVNDRAIHLQGAASLMAPESVPPMSRWVAARARAAHARRLYCASPQRPTFFPSSNGQLLPGRETERNIEPRWGELGRMLD
jgi:hypothetical protein